MILLQRYPKLGPWLFGAILLLCACFAHATSYYVDCNNGSNGNPGTFDQPWRTPLKVGAYAAATGFNAGDAIYFHRDCAWHDGITLGWVSGGQTNSGSSGNLLTIDSYGGYNSQPFSSGPGTGAAPRFTGLFPIADNACALGGGSGTHHCWCKGTWSSPGNVPTCTLVAGNVWSARPLFDDNGSHSDNCASDGGNCEQCPAAGLRYSCYDQPLNVLNFVRFGTIWGNNQEGAIEAGGTIAASLTQDRDWYFNPATSGASLQTLYVYCACTGGVTPDVYFGQVAPIAISGEDSPFNGAPVMLGLTGVQYLQIQHLLFDWYDGLGILVQGNTTGSVPIADHIWLANIAANSYVENSVYRYNSNRHICVSPTACATLGTGTVEQYTQIGLWVNNNWTGSGTAFTDIHAWNLDLNMNYVGAQVGATGYACGGCNLDLENDRIYANRTYGVLDQIGGAAHLSYSHLYANNLATALETDVQTNFNLPAAGFTCSGTTASATWTTATSPAVTLTAGESFIVNTANALSPSGYAGTFTVLSASGSPLTLTWTVPACLGAATGGSITVTAVNDQGNNLAYSGPTNNYSNLVAPWVQGWQRWPAYVTLTYDDPGLVQYSDNYVAQILPLATAKLGSSNFSIAVVTGGNYSGLNVNQTDANPGFVAEVQGWINSGYDVLTHSTSHAYWKPPASSCGAGSVFKVPCHILDLLHYTGSVASTVTLTISHNATTCGSLGVSSGACFIVTTSPSDASANIAWDLTSLFPWSAGASTSFTNIGALIATLNQRAVFATTPAACGSAVCIDQYGNSAALSHSFDDTYSSSAVLGGVSLISPGFNVDFLNLNDTAAEPPYFEFDEMSWADTWMDHYLTGMPTNRVYVMPGTYGDSASENQAAAAGYGGVRGTGALKPCCGANTTLGNGYDKFNILSQGINPNFQNLSYAQTRALLQADAFRNALWGRPIGYFWHIYELPPDQVENLMDGLKQAGATVVSNTGFLNNVLLNAPLAGHVPVSGQCVPNTVVPPIGTGDNGSSYVAGSFYACPSTGVEADWRETVNSPTLNAGNSQSSAFQYDLRGNNRNNFGSGWDIGSHQFVPMSMGTVKHP